MITGVVVGILGTLAVEFVALLIYAVLKLEGEDEP